MLNICILFPVFYAKHRGADWPTSFVLAKSLPLRRVQVTFNILTVLLIFRCSRMQNILRTPNLTAPAGSEATIRAYVSRFQMDWRLRQADEVLYFEFLCTYVYLSVERILFELKHRTVPLPWSAGSNSTSTESTTGATYTYNTPPALRLALSCTLTVIIDAVFFCSPRPTVYLLTITNTCTNDGEPA